MSRAVLAVVLLTMSQCSVSRIANAQDDSSQRILPLPRKDVPGLPTQMELLQQLRSMIESKGTGEPGDTSPGRDFRSPEYAAPLQFERLRSALEKLRGQLPPDFVPPDLSTIPKAQLEQTLKNPEVQQQLREMLEQFSKDGILPSPGRGAPALPTFPRPPDSKAPAVPSRSRSSSDLPLIPRPTDNDLPVEDSAVAPDGDTRYAPSPERRPGQSVSEPDATESQHDGSIPDSSLSALKDFLENLAGRKRPGEPGVESGKVDASQQKSLEALQDVLQQMQESRPGTSPLDWLNDERIEKAIQDSANSSDTEALSPGLTHDPEQFVPPSDPEQFRSGQTGLSPLVPGMVPVPPRGLQQQESTHGPLSREPIRDGSPPSNAAPGALQPRPDRPEESASTDRRSPEQPDSNIDIRKELERRGFGETMKKIIEQARQESRQSKSESALAGTPEESSDGGTTTAAGMEKSMIRMLDGLKDELVEIAKDTRFRDRSADRSVQDRSRTERRAPAAESSLSKFRKAATDIFSDVADAPKGRSSATPGASSPGQSPFGPGFDLTPVAVLAGMLLLMVAGFLGLRFWQTRSGAALAGGLPVHSIQSNDIRDRADVVRAFHEFALHSAKSVQAWWTHRAVENAVAIATPDRRLAAATLTDAYEQARYLPEDQELSADQLQQTRSALLQFSAAPPETA